MSTTPTRRNATISCKPISDVNRLGLSPRVIGFDDTPFQSRPRVPGSELNAVGVVTSSDRFEGMLYCSGIIQDGLNAGEVLSKAIQDSKFHSQIHAVLLDGITMGGLNVIDIERLAAEVQRPVIAVMRSLPNIPRMNVAISKVSNQDERRRRVTAAGQIYELGSWVFQYKVPPMLSKEEPEEIATLLQRCTPDGTQKIPESLRVAHLIGAAVKIGHSSSSA